MELGRTWCHRSSQVPHLYMPHLRPHAGCITVDLKRPVDGKVGRTVRGSGNNVSFHVSLNKEDGRSRFLILSEWMRYRMRPKQRGIRNRGLFDERRGMHRSALQVQPMSALRLGGGFDIMVYLLSRRSAARRPEKVVRTWRTDRLLPRNPR